MRPSDNNASLIVADLHALFGIAPIIANPSEPIRWKSVYCVKTLLVGKAAHLVRLLGKFKSYVNFLAVGFAGIFIAPCRKHSTFCS